MTENKIWPTANMYVQSKCNDGEYKSSRDERGDSVNEN